MASTFTRILTVAGRLARTAWLATRPARLAVAAAVYVLGVAGEVRAADLPVACTAGACGAGGPGAWVTSGNVTSALSGQRLNITQTTDKAVLNWAEFNVAAGNTVNFVQPGASSLAINRIFQNSPSRIFGVLTANGQVYLINQNGILFGKGSQVNVGSLVASSLPLDDRALANGILDPALLRTGKAAFAGDGRAFVLDQNGQPLTDASGQPIPVRVVVEQGAVLKSDPKGGGRLMLVGQEVDNAGELDAGKGQVILAAGQKVYVQASTDPDLRGLLVEVDAGGKAWNQVTGQVNAAEGNITLVGLAVNQDGRLSATTSVSTNGSVRLLARDTVKVDSSSSATEVAVSATNAGSVEFGSNSVVEVLPDVTDRATAVDAQAQLQSAVEVVGRQIVMDGGSRITVPGGSVSLTALPNPSMPEATGQTPLATDPDARIRLQAGSVIDVSGSVAAVPVSRNLVNVELRANELKDSPLQRNGVLRGQTVTVDARVGTPLADVSGALANIQRGVQERTSTGGTVNLNSQGDIVMAQGATINVSGGAVQYQGGTVETSKLVTADGRIVDIGQADPNRLYVGVSTPTITVKDPKWGITTTYARAGTGTFDPGYVDGKSAGTVGFAAPGLAISGTLLGQAIGGLLQRSPASQPAGGTLIIGDPLGQGLRQPDFRAPSVRFAASPLTLNLDPDEPLPADWQILPLPTQYLRDGGFSRTQVYSNGTITLDGSLTLRSGSWLSLTGSAVNIAGQLNAPAGNVALRSVTVNPAVLLSADQRPGVFVGDNTRIDVGGTWVNDSPLLAGRNPATPLYTNGGSITAAVTAQAGALIIGSGVALLADAGAQLTAIGKLAGGAGGAISLNAGGPGVAVAIGSDLQLSAFGFNKGGSLQLTVGDLRIEHGVAFSVSQLSDPAATDFRALVIGDSLFGDGGFHQVSLTGTGARLAGSGGAAVEPLVIASDAALLPRLTVLSLAPDAGDLSGAASARDLVTPVLPPDYARSAVSLGFAIQPNANVQPETAGDLVMESGASIRTDPGGQVAFSGPTRIRLDGDITVPAGSVTAQVSRPPGGLDQGYDPAVGIFVGSTGKISVAGTSVIKPSDIGLRVGSVLDGGNISLSATRGTATLAAGSLLDASGTAAMLDLAPGGNSSATTGYLRQTVTSAGGSISVLAPEALVLDGQLNLAAGAAPAGQPQPAGGSLSLGISRQRGFATQEPPNPFPTNPRQFVIGGPAGDPVNGTVRLDPAALVATGLANLTLQADDAVIFGQDLSLLVPNALSLQAPNLVASNGVSQVNLTANTLALGPRLLVSSGAAAASAGGATLRADAHLIDLFGDLSLQGFGTTTLRSATDLRATGLPLTNSGPLTGSLAAAGTLNLAAARIYPGTFTKYDVTVAPADGGVLNLTATGVDATTPLSGAGEISLSAANINQGTALLAPLGRITLAATDSLALLPGSRTSVSAGGQLIPFGTVQGGTDWTYQAVTGTFTPVTAAPDKRISLSGRTVDVAGGATVDLSGGGDLYAWEFVPGPGGSKDTLAPDVSSGLYAVLPGLGASPAPYDTQEYAGSTLQPWNSVHLDGVAEVLAAGDYTLLPARYALLPGAVLVQAVTSVRDLPAGAATTLTDGTPVVAGYGFVGGTNLRDSRTTGFAIRPGSYARQLAEYDDNFAGTFFARAAADNDQPVPLLPRDAGLLQVNVGDSLTLAGALSAAAGAGGRGARVDVSASDLRIASAGAAQESGIVTVQADSLNALGAESLLLGGTRSTNGADTTVNLAASTVTVQSGATLAAPEVILAARNDIDIASGAGITATGTTTASAAEGQTLTLAGSAGGAVVRATTGAQVDVRRAVAGTAGDVLIEQGATVAGAGAVAVDAAGTARSFGTLDASAGSLALGSGRIALGTDQGAVANGLALSSQQLQSVAGLRELRLTGSRSIDFAGPTVLGGGSATPGQLTLNTPALVGSGSDALLGATTILLENTGAASAAVPVQGTGGLTLAAENLLFGAGTVGVSGFAGADLQGSRQILGTGTFALQSAADLTLQAPLVTGKSGATVALLAPGRDVALVGSNAVPALAPTTATGIGAALDVAAAHLTADTSLIFGGGNINLRSEQDLTLGNEAVLDASGRSVAVGSAAVTVPAGNVSLIARGGDVAMTSGTRVDVSAGTAGGQSGELDVFAGGAASLAGTLSGAASDPNRSGTLRLYAGQGTDFAALNAKLNSGGFARRREIETGHGDISIAAADTVRAEQVVLAASGTTSDNGATRDASVAVAGIIDARAEGGGNITLAARGNVALASGSRLDASNSGASGSGGRVTLSSEQGQVSVVPGSAIAVNGPEAGGTVTVRATATPDGGMAVPVFDTAAVQGAASIILQPVIRTAATTLDVGTISGFRSQVDSYMQSAPAVITAAVNPGEPSLIHVRPELEVTSPADLGLATNWDLSTWRYNGEPGVLTLRVAGNLQLNGDISDGVQQNGAAVTAGSDSSWSYMLAAGADTASALPWATAGRLMDSGTTGTLTVGAGRRVRTGTGSIGLFADADLVLADKGALVYTTGVVALPARRIGLGANALTASWLRDGGDIIVAAGRDVVGTQGSQILSGWDIRTGQQSGVAQWAVELGKFQQGIAALGGGNVAVTAGRDVTNVSVTIPTTGAERSAEPDVFDSWGGGNLAVRAGRDILSGVYSAWHGNGSIHAGRDIASGYNAGGSDFHTLLAFGAGSFAVSARRDIGLEGVLNPTTVQPFANAGSLDKPYFFTYAPTDSLRVIATAGDLEFFNNLSAFSSVVGQTVAGATRGFGVYPASVRAAAPDGDITIDRSMNLLPAPTGVLELLAGGSLVAPAANVVMSDDLPSSLASPAALSSATALGSGIADYAAAAIHVGDTAPVRLVAANGDIRGGTYLLPKSVDAQAARDVRDVWISAQNVNPGDTSLVQAGRDVRFSDSSNRIEVGGGGRLEVLAGRNVNLGFGRGIITVGNTRNPQLPAGTGADIEVWAGLPATLYADDFIGAYFAVPAGPYAQLLIAYVQAQTGKTGLSQADALAAFRSFSPESQRRLFVAVLFAELRGAGRDADFNRGAAAIATLIPAYDDFISSYLDPAGPAGTRYLSALVAYVTDKYLGGSAGVGFTPAQALADFRGFARDQQRPLLLTVLSAELQRAADLALTNADSGRTVQQAALRSLFTAGGTVSGDLSLVFSQIYTLAGGDINLLVPGGRVDVGLAKPPQNSTIAKRPADLGIVAEGPGSVRVFAGNDVLVNQSRIFTLQGGDILIWSTAGNIDAGRGAKTAISAPAPTITIDANGQLDVQFSDAIAGSGIRGILTRDDIKPGDVDLDAPNGEINAGDAGIASAGNLTAFTPRFTGIDNIQVGGVSTGVPTETSIASSLTGVSGLGASAAQSATAGGEEAASKGNTPAADAAMGWLEVFVEGFGDKDEQDADKDRKKRDGSGT